MPRPLSTRTAVVAGRRMRRPHEFRRSPQRRGLPRPLSTHTAVVAGRRMRRPYGFRRSPQRRGIASPSFDTHGGGCRAAHASPPTNLGDLRRGEALPRPSRYEAVLSQGDACVAPTEARQPARSCRTRRCSRLKSFSSRYGVRSNDAGTRVSFSSSICFSCFVMKL